METSYTELKCKEVINLCDGKRLGKVCDVVFTYPEGRVQGIVAPGGRGFRFGKGDLFIDLKNISKIGIDVVLVDIRSAPKPEKKKGGSKWGSDYQPPAEEPPPRRPPADRRDYGEYE
ncbi:MAG: YlmC/YmxH family sporulation protein [Clostridia bacterium]|nr:YlmC/YmxH family sporulation protein [Clostridia bacterium]